MAQPPRLSLSEVSRRGVTSVHDLSTAAADIFRHAQSSLEVSPALTITGANPNAPVAVSKLADAKATYIRHFEHIQVLIQTAQSAEPPRPPAATSEQIAERDQLRQELVNYKDEVRQLLDGLQSLQAHNQIISEADPTANRTGQSSKKKKSNTGRQNQPDVQK